MAKLDANKMRTMWALVSPKGYFLIVFRTKAGAHHERVHFRPETRIEKVQIRLYRKPNRKPPAQPDPAKGE